MVLMDWIRRHDPGLIALRRAGRTAVVMPAVFAVADVVIGKPTLALFTAFGLFATLLFVDFTGPMRDRLLAQTGLVATGAVLVCVGTLASRHIWLGVPVTFLIGFAVLFSGVVSSVFASATNALLLSFVLPVALPGPPSAIPDRLFGWLLAGGASLFAISLLWPAPAREPLRAPTAKACRLSARQLRAEAQCMQRDFSPQELEARHAAADELRTAVNNLRTVFFKTPYRPTCLTASARIVVRLVDEVIWLQSILDRTPFEPEQRPTDEIVTRVKVAAAHVLDNVADVMSTTSDAAQRLQVNLDHLGQTRAQLEQLATDNLPKQHSSATAATRPTGAPEQKAADFFGTLEPTFRAHELASAVGAIGTTVELAVTDLSRTRWQRLFGRGIPDAAGSPIIISVRQRAATHVEPHSVWLHNSVRAGAALGLAVLIVEVSNVQHSFWVVLGALAVLRSNALNTGQNALNAFLGTGVGIIIGGALVYFLGAHTVALWLVFPVVIFFAGLAPAVISFAAGQAGFTTTLLILFNLIGPAGWRIGIVRIEDVAIGCGVSLVVGVLFWPRGAASVMSRSLSEALSDTASYLGRAIDYGLTRCDCAAAPASPPIDEATRAAAASRRLDDAFRNYLAERGAKHFSLADLTTLMNAVAVLRLTADAILELWSGAGPPQGDRTQARRVVRSAGDRLTAWFEHAAEALLGQGQVPRPTAIDSSASARLVAALAQDLNGEDNHGAAAAVRMLWTEEHIDAASRREAKVAGPVEKVHSVRRSGGRRTSGPRRLKRHLFPSSRFASIRRRVEAGRLPAEGRAD